MSTILGTENERRNWLPVAAGVCFLAAFIWGALLWRADRSFHSGDGSAGDIGAITEVSLPQADWQIKTFPAGGGKPTRTDRKMLAREGPKLSALVEDVYDALVLHRDQVAKLGGKVLSPEVARALASSKLAPPAAASGVQTLVRKARIGIARNGGRFAAARVSLKLKGVLDGKKIRLAQRSTLWLARPRGQWKVIAFEGERSAR